MKRIMMAALLLLAGAPGALAQSTAPATSIPAEPTPGHPVIQGGVVYSTIPRDQGASPAWQAPPGPQSVARPRRFGRSRLGALSVVGGRRRVAAPAEGTTPDPSLVGTQPP